MSRQTALSNDLNVEDFRRLGVRPNEVRLSVIRGAASRNAMPLANQLLAASSEDGNGEDGNGSKASASDPNWNESWLQLSRVVTSTYRLMDPRLRPNSHQRAYIGRILPLAINASATAQFQKTKAAAQADVSETPSSLIDTSTSGPVPPPVSNLFRNPDIADDIFATATAQSTDAETWQLSLDDRDLASGSRIRRQRNTVTRNAWVWASMASGGILVGSILGWNSLSKTSDTDAAIKTVAAIEKNHPTTVPSAPSISNGNGSLAATTKMTETPSNQQPDPTETDRELESSSMVTPTVIESNLPIASLPDVTDYLPINPVTTDALAEASNGAVTEAASVLNTATSMVRADSAMATPILKMPIQSGEALPTVPQGPFPAPKPEDVANARREMLQSIDADNVSITSVNLETIRDWVADVLLHSSPGSPDHYAAGSMLGSLAWLESSPHQPSLTTMSSQLDAYQVDETDVWTKSYIDASEHVTLPEDLNEFFIAGFGLIETLIKREAIDQASEVLSLIQNRSDQFSSDQDGINELNEDNVGILIASYQKSIKYAERLSTTAQRVLRLHGQIESIPTDVSGGSSLGRYYCLVLGDWCQGLRFLAETSDPRLAALAKREGEMHAGDPFLSDPNAWVELADQWQRAADRLSGRAAIQVRLHAIELLNQSSWRATAIAKSDAEQRTEAILKRLPLHLKLHPNPTEANTVSAVAAIAKSKSIMQEKADQDPPASGYPESGNDWLVGRINMDGEDLGVNVRYQLDVAINPTMLQAIEKQLRRPLENASIEFEGEFSCKEDQWVILTLSPPSDSAREAVFLNGEPIQMDPPDHSTRLLIPAGEHSLRWKTQLTDTELTFSCSLRDAQTGQRLTMTTSPGQMDAASTGDLTVSVMRSSN